MEEHKRFGNGQITATRISLVSDPKLNGLSLSDGEIQFFLSIYWLCF